MEQLIVRNIELDKICRICLAVKKEMRPLFGEMIAEMLMEIAKIQIEQMDGWPDKICVQCIHQVSRCHAFKTRVERSDIALRQYIKGITVTVDPDNKDCIPTDIGKMSLSPPKLQQVAPAPMIPPQLHELHIQRTDMQAIQTEAPMAAPAMILTSAQLINAGAQIINTGHIITTATGQQIIQTTPQFQAASIGQFIQGPNNTVQMITQNGHPAHVLQIQRTADDRCEIIVQPDLTEAQYLENVSSVPLMVTAPAPATALPTDGMHAHQLQAHHHHMAMEQTEEHTEHGTHETELEESEPETQMHEKLDEDVEYVLPDDETIETDEIIEEGGGMDEAEMEYYAETECEESDDEEKQIAEFLTYQTSCPSPGRYKVNKIPTCSICNKEFKSKSILYRHRQTHFEKNFECSMCEKKFSSNYQLNIHEQRHKKQKCHKCPHCDKAFFNETELKNHIQHHLGATMKQNKKIAISRS
uniref:Protein krueppel n=1 Tax=Anopheles minimus TaxID=112268 RepID=A0A182WAS9_9DIPT